MFPFPPVMGIKTIDSYLYYMPIIITNTLVIIRHIPISMLIHKLGNSHPWWESKKARRKETPYITALRASSIADSVMGTKSIDMTIIIRDKTIDMYLWYLCLWAHTPYYYNKAKHSYRGPSLVLVIVVHWTNSHQWCELVLNSLTGWESKMWRRRRRRRKV